MSALILIRSKALTAALVTLLCSIGASDSRLLAATRSWDGGGGADNDWSTAANWSFNTVPGVGDVAEFNRGGRPLEYVVEFPFIAPFGGDINTSGLLIGFNTVTFQPGHSNTGYNVQSIIIGYEANEAAVLNMNLAHMSANTVTIGGYIEFNADGTLNIANNDQLTVTGSAPSNTEFVLGNDGTGTLNISSGGKVILTGADGDILLGTYNGTGIVTVTGAGSTFSTADQMWVGENGTGTIDVTAGGQLNSGASYIGYYTSETGEVTVDGIGSAWTNSGEMYIGDFGHALLEITSGGTVNNGTAYVGDENSSTGNVRIDGAQSTWTNGEMYIGDQGDGTVEITGGGHLVSSGLARVGVGSNGTGSVIVDGSIWDADGVIVGDFGHGSVEVVNGGRVNSATLFATRAAAIAGGNPLGEVRIDGEDSAWVCDFGVTIGYLHGEGRLDITNGAQLTGKTATIGADFQMFTATGSATVNGAGSLWTTIDDFNIGRGLFGGGSLTVTNGGTASVGGLLTVGGVGEIHGDGNIVGNVQNGGLVSPGTSPGALNIDGNYAQTADGELLIELASESVYDQLLVSGDATLGGILTVNLLDGFVPSVGQSFTLLTADDVDETFDIAMLPSVSGRIFDVTYNPTNVVLTAFQAALLPGDYNQNGTVNAADYTLWRDNLGRTTALPNDDTAGVGSDDYTRWKAHFGETAGSGSGATATAAIPEPATLVLLTILTASWCLRRRRAA